MNVTTATTSFIETQFPVSKLSKESYKLDSQKFSIGFSRSVWHIRQR